MMPSLYRVITIFFFLTMSSARPLNSSENCFLVNRWHIFVTSNLPDNMNLHFHGSQNSDKTVVLSSGQAFDWSFCKTGNQQYFGDFNWGSRSVSLTLFDNHVNRICNRFKVGTRHCYWLVNTGGFFVSRTNPPFPNDEWHFERSWS